jgi:hypothetical protein
MANVRADQAPARSEIGLAAVFALGAALSVALVVAPGSAQAAEAANVVGLPQSQPSLLHPPVTTTAPAVNAVSGSPSPSRWARVPRWQKVLGVGAILTGLAAVGSGAYLLWLDGQYTCRSAACPPSNKYNTALAGWLLMAGGTAASLGGVSLLLVPPIGESRSHAVARLALSAAF